MSISPPLRDAKFWVGDRCDQKVRESPVKKIYVLKCLKPNLNIMKLGDKHMKSSIVKSVFFLIVVVANQGLAKVPTVIDDLTITETTVITDFYPVAIGRCLVSSEPYPSEWNLGRKYSVGFLNFYEKKILVIIKDKATNDIIHKEVTTDWKQESKMFSDGRYYKYEREDVVDSALADCEKHQGPLRDLKKQLDAAEASF